MVTPAVDQHIGEPWFEHDFDHIAYNADEFNVRVGMPSTARRAPETS